MYTISVFLVGAFVAAGGRSSKFVEAVAVIGGHETCILCESCSERENE